MKKYKIHWIHKESNITIISESKIAILKAKDIFHYHRKILESYVLKDRHFLTSFSPVKVKTDFTIINLMAKVASLCEVIALQIFSYYFSHVAS